MPEITLPDANELDKIGGVLTAETREGLEFLRDSLTDHIMDMAGLLSPYKEPKASGNTKILKVENHASYDAYFRVSREKSPQVETLASSGLAAVQRIGVDAAKRGNLSLEQRQILLGSLRVMADVLLEKADEDS